MTRNICSGGRRARGKGQTRGVGRGKKCLPISHSLSEDANVGVQDTTAAPPDEPLMVASSLEKSSTSTLQKQPSVASPSKEPSAKVPPICLTPRSFYSRKEVTNAVKNIITSNYKGQWIRYIDVPVETRKFWFQEFNELELGRPPTALELYSKVWKNSNGDWCGPRAQKIGESLTKLYHDQSGQKRASSMSGSNASSSNAHDDVIRTCGNFKKGRLPGMGSESKTFVASSSPGMSSGPHPSEKMELDMLKEKLQQNEMELQETKARLEKTEDRLQHILDVVEKRIGPVLA